MLHLPCILNWKSSSGNRPGDSRVVGQHQPFAVYSADFLVANALCIAAQKIRGIFQEMFTQTTNNVTGSRYESQTTQQFLQTRECGDSLRGGTAPGNAMGVVAQDQQPLPREPAAVKIPADQLDFLWRDRSTLTRCSAKPWWLRLILWRSFSKQWLTSMGLKGEGFGCCAEVRQDPSSALAGLPDLVKQLADNTSGQ